MDYFKYFETVKAFNDFLLSTPRKKAWVRAGVEESTRESAYKTQSSGTASYDEANQLMLFGDAEIAKKINTSGYLDNKLKIERDRKKRIFRSSLVGHAPHVANYVAGVPNSMIRTENVTQKKKIITIAYMPTFSHRETVDDVIKAGVEFLSAVLMIENEGYTVNLLCVFYSKDRAGRDSVTSCVKIKDSDQRIDVLNVAYPMCHPSYCRRHNLRFIEETLNKVWCCYGHCGSESEVRETLNKNNIQCDAVISYYGVKGLTKEEIIKKYFGNK